jgi:hypothetical protein
VSTPYFPLCHLAGRPACKHVCGLRDACASGITMLRPQLMSIKIVLCGLQPGGHADAAPAATSDLLLTPPLLSVTSTLTHHTCRAKGFTTVTASLMFFSFMFSNSAK